MDYKQLYEELQAKYEILFVQFKDTMIQAHDYKRLYENLLLDFGALMSSQRAERLSGYCCSDCGVVCDGRNFYFSRAGNPLSYCKECHESRRRERRDMLKINS